MTVYLVLYCSRPDKHGVFFIIWGTHFFTHPVYRFRSQSVSCACTLTDPGRPWWLEQRQREPLYWWQGLGVSTPWDARSWAACLITSCTTRTVPLSSAPRQKDDKHDADDMWNSYYLVPFNHSSVGINRCSASGCSSVVSNVIVGLQQMNDWIKNLTDYSNQLHPSYRLVTYEYML